MVAFLRRLFTSVSCIRRRTTGSRPPAVLSLEQLEDRVTPSTLPAFTGLTVADKHFLPPDPCIQQAPVFALNYQVPPDPVTPLGALIGAFAHWPPQPAHSPVLVGVEAYLSGGVTNAG